MPFDWMEPKRNPAYTKTLPAKREAMYRRELEERAALLHRLGHSRAHAQARLAANAGWDFEESGGSPSGGGPMDAVVKEILDREYGGATGATDSIGAPRTKGEKR
jgi:hypothetical protein